MQVFLPAEQIAKRNYPKGRTKTERSGRAETKTEVVQLGKVLIKRVMSEETQIADRVEELLIKPFAGIGLELLDVEYRYEGRWVLRLTIDKEQGINLDDCGEASSLAARILDVEDPVPNEFALEVSSPGVFRPLRVEKHYRQSIGKIARLKLTAEALPENKEGIVRGTIVKAENETVTLDVDGQTVELALIDVASARLDPEL